MDGGNYRHVRTVKMPGQLKLDRDAMLAEFVSESLKKGSDAAVNFTFTVKIEDLNIGLKEDEPYIFPVATYVMKAYLIKR